MAMTVGDLRRILLGWDDNCILRLKGDALAKVVNVAGYEQSNDWSYEDIDEEYCECCGHEIQPEPDRVDVMVLIGGNE